MFEIYIKYVSEWPLCFRTHNFCQKGQVSKIFSLDFTFKLRHVTDCSNYCGTRDRALVVENLDII